MSLHLLIFIQDYYGLFSTYKDVFKLIIFLCLTTISKLKIVIQQLESVDGCLYTLYEELANYGP